MAHLATSEDYATQVRVLLQDTISPYRYADDDIIRHLNIALMEIRRVRPDIMQAYFGIDTPELESPPDTTPVTIDQMYRSTVVYFVAGMTQLIDDETNDDSRAGAFMSKFVAQLTQAAA